MSSVTCGCVSRIPKPGFILAPYDCVAVVSLGVRMTRTLPHIQYAPQMMLLLIFMMWQ